MRRIPGWRRNVAALVSSTFLFGAAFAWTPRIVAQQGSFNEFQHADDQEWKDAGRGRVLSKGADLHAGRSGRLAPPGDEARPEKTGGDNRAAARGPEVAHRDDNGSSAHGHLANHPRVAVARHLLQTDPNAPNPTLPTFDWSQLGFVGSVKDQGNCGCCWDFASVGVFESMYAIRNGKENLLNLSEEQLLRSQNQSPPGNCCGGWWPLDFIRDNGLVGADHLAYTSGALECPQIPPAMGTVQGRIYQGRGLGLRGRGRQRALHDLLKQALCDHGPLLVAVMATPSFQAYDPSKYPGGLFSEAGVRARPDQSRRHDRRLDAEGLDRAKLLEGGLGRQGLYLNQVWQQQHRLWCRVGGGRSRGSHRIAIRASNRRMQPRSRPCGTCFASRSEGYYVG